MAFTRTSRLTSITERRDRFNADVSPLRDCGKQLGVSHSDSFTCHSEAKRGGRIPVFAKPGEYGDPTSSFRRLLKGGRRRKTGFLPLTFKKQATNSRRLNPQPNAAGRCGKVPTKQVAGCFETDKRNGFLNGLIRIVKEEPSRLVSESAPPAVQLANFFRFNPHSAQNHSQESSIARVTICQLPMAQQSSDQVRFTCAVRIHAAGNLPAIHQDRCGF